MRLNFITVTENKLRFVWETEVFLSSLRENGYATQANVLIFLTNNKPKLAGWARLEELYPEVRFYYYPDKDISRIGTTFNYPPIHRLYCLQEHWKANPWLENQAILYTDTDIIFSRPLDFNKFLQDDINYLSWTGNDTRTDNYLWQPYLDSKIANVNPQKLDHYKRIDIVNKLGQICGIDRETITENNPNTGGAQYLLKGVTQQFWTSCFNTCCEIKMYLAGLNQTYMKGATAQEKENNGFQSWCADMWCVLYNLWSHGKKTECPPELDFAWSTDRIEKLDTMYILHNAGVTDEAKITVAKERNPDGSRVVYDGPLFFKGKYNFSTPLEDNRLMDIYNDPVNKQFCNNRYIAQILKTKQ